MITKKWVFIICLFVFTNLHSQGVGIGTLTPHASSSLDVSSTTDGVLLPRMTSAQRIAIVNPAQGLLVFDIDKKAVCLFDGISWNPLMYSNSFSKLPPTKLESPPNFFHTGIFGFDIDISGNYAIIGSPFDSINGNLNQGSAFIYYHENGTWSYQAKLIALDGNDEDYFGKSVSISGDYAIVGSPNWDNLPLFTDNGAAYIYQRSGTTWTQVAKLTAADAASSDTYGEDVSIDGDYVIVGAPLDDTGPQTESGSAYIYYKGSGWINGHPLQAKVLASDGLLQDFFGISVSISGSFALVGANGDDNAMPPYAYMEGAYIFQRSGTTWSQTAKLIPDPAANSFYGVDVDINGDYAIIGAEGEQGFKGAAYIYYKGSGWVNNQSYQTKLTAYDAAVNENLGARVRITDQFALMGGGFYDNELEDDGGIYLYQRTGTAWNYQRKIVDDTAQSGAIFGKGIGISDYNLIIGVPFKFNLKGEIQSINIQ